MRQLSNARLPVNGGDEHTMSKKAGWGSWIAVVGFVASGGGIAQAQSKPPAGDPFAELPVFEATRKESPKAAPEPPHEATERQTSTPDRKWSISVGAFSPDYRTGFKLVPSGGGPALGVVLEGILGLESEVRTARLTGQVWLNRRDSLHFSYYGSRRQSLIALKQDVTIGDTTFPQGLGVRTALTADQLQLKYQNWSILSRDLRMATTVGVHVTKFNGSVKGTGGVTLSEGASVTAPLPLLGLALRYDISRSWVVAAQIEGLRLKISNINGRVINYGYGIHYSDVSGWGGGLSFEYQDITVKADERRFDGSFEYRYRGPMLFVTYSF